MINTWCVIYTIIFKKKQQQKSEECQILSIQVN